MESLIPTAAEPQNLEHTVLAQIPANLLRQSNANVFCKLLCAACMRDHLGDCFEDEVKIADRDAFREQ